ncbi:aldose 1-epimerase [Alicyclobacillus fastidiosus]|uniref:Aldose 1-epimerase n=1 Tax=Alicyclobacillus fastidiosus TaxID=392011 RepID=A0ABV5A935_9BACL|nr:aldose 1-epimerase [Alicyclobacillus fastidiosus]WEH10737.1 aldose 1-epimerase [Alicyclobacillus fastidiosus]
MTASVREITYHGEKAVCFEYGPFQAVVLPEIGANLISFRDVERGLSFLREPTVDEMPEFTSSPTKHGIPVLFPPNRFEDGVFSIGEYTYQLPINEPSRNNHLHGFLHSVAWDVTATGRGEHDAFAVFTLVVDEEHPVYKAFPHCFRFDLEYRLSNTGLRQTVSVQNQGTSPMPCMLGFHTAISVPFSERSTKSDYLFTATVGRRLELSERMLPTGNHLDLAPAERSMQTVGVNPFFEPMDNHYTARPEKGRNFATVTDRREHIRLVYDVGVKYRHWMIWNNEAGGSFFCPEPQINRVNAPNLSLASEETGLVILKQGETWSEVSTMFIEDVID